MLGVCLSVEAMAQGALTFDANAGVKSKMTLYDGTEVNFTAYERLFYVTNVEDSTYQYLNVYVPDGAIQRTPIFLRTYVGGYMASPATQPQSDDATGKALKEGYVTVIPGTRGRNSASPADEAYAKTHKGVKSGQTVYTGRAPKAILDLKAAIRYLRHFDKEMPGDAERIVTDGTSAGGAMSALMGAMGNLLPTPNCCRKWGQPMSAMTCLPRSATAPSSTSTMLTWPTNGYISRQIAVGPLTKHTGATPRSWLHCSLRM